MRKPVLFFCGALFVSGAIFAGDRIFNKPGTYGPYTCLSCRLQTQAPEETTLKFIESMDDANAKKLPAYAEIAGDTFIVCNGTQCVTYTRTDSLDLFRGGAPRLLINSGGGTGGGGGGGGGGHGGTPGGGGSSGSVKVGDVEQVKE